jgi:palmitoyl-protein thioesterase
MYFANLFFLLTLFCVHEVLTTTPIVMWHGVGSDHLDSLKQIIRENVNEDVYIKSIQLGANAIEETENGIFIHPNDQILRVCDEIMQDDNLKDGFHAIGFSQGGQFL